MFLEKCALNCLCKDGHDGKGRIRVCCIIDEISLKKPVPAIEATDIKVRNALRLAFESLGCKCEIDPYDRVVTIYGDRMYLVHPHETLW